MCIRAGRTIDPIVSSLSPGVYSGTFRSNYNFHQKWTQIQVLYWHECVKKHNIAKAIDTYKHIDKYK